ncbi:MAG: hypothetical protein Q8S00_16100, partial [Deltaproteobacteria bacterium]|nr:hypothetical protein [Deltaproteobacteria bacterium]
GSAQLIKHCDFLWRQHQFGTSRFSSHAGSITHGIANRYGSMKRYTSRSMAIENLMNSQKTALLRPRVLQEAL